MKNISILFLFSIVPSLPPERVSCKASSSTSFQVQWDDPPLEGRHGVIRGYKVMHQVASDFGIGIGTGSSGEVSMIPIGIGIPPPPVSSSSSSSSSSATSGTTMSLLENSGPNERTIASESSNDNQRGSSGSGGGGGGEDGEFPVETKMTTSKSTSLHGLERWTNYSVSVLAFTAMGDGKLSVPIICHTDEDSKYNFAVLLFSFPLHSIQSNPIQLISYSHKSDFFKMALSALFYIILSTASDYMHVFSSTVQCTLYNEYCTVCIF